MTVSNDHLKFYKGLVKPVFKTDHLPQPFKPFEQSHALVTVSVGQEVHEGEKFLATLDLINQSFARCTLCVDDTLQRHTLAMGGDLTSEDLLEYSRRLGDEWLVRNFPAYSKLTLPYEIIRWNKWLKHPSYEAIFQEIQKLYEKDEKDEKDSLGVAKVFQQTSRQFLDRYLPRLEAALGDFSPAKIRKAEELSLLYLFEECTALCLWGMEGYDYEVYPSRRNDAMNLIHDLWVKPKYGSVIAPVWVKFKNRKQLKPQILEISSKVSDFCERE